MNRARRVYSNTCKRSCFSKKSMNNYKAKIQNQHMKQLTDFAIKLLVLSDNIINSRSMESNYSFAGMTLTEIFEIQSLQSLFIKFWYLGLTSEGVIAPEDASLFKAIKKSITFANCFSYEMPLRTYINFTDKILQALEAIHPRSTFEILLGHLRNNKVISVSFQLFGVAFLQLFGRILELLNAQLMNKILRKIFIQITILGKMGVSSLKIKGIKPIVFEDLLPNFDQLLQQTTNNSNNLRPNPEQMSLPLSQTKLQDRDYDMKTMKGRFEGLRELNAQHRQSEGDHYPPGEKVKNRDKASISCFMMGGFEIVDYSQSINQLHKKLLTKILLNK